MDTVHRRHFDPAVNGNSKTSKERICADSPSS